MATSNSLNQPRAIKTTSFFTKNLNASSTSTAYQTIQACRERVLKSSVLHPIPPNKPHKKQQSPLLVQRIQQQADVKRGIAMPYQTKHIRVNSPLHQKTLVDVKPSDPSPPVETA